MEVRLRQIYGIQAYICIHTDMSTSIFYAIHKASVT